VPTAPHGRVGAPGVLQGRAGFVGPLTVASRRNCWRMLVREIPNADLAKERAGKYRSSNIRRLELQTVVRFSS
jgi:hypothetical protein